MLYDTTNHDLELRKQGIFIYIPIELQVIEDILPRLPPHIIFQFNSVISMYIELKI
jgi:hypothetical protein